LGKAKWEKPTGKSEKRGKGEHRKSEIGKCIEGKGEKRRIWPENRRWKKVNREKVLLTTWEMVDWDKRRGKSEN
jgi:hypothetical protein